jgi:hypothetical protein
LGGKGISDYTSNAGKHKQTKNSDCDSPKDFASHVMFYGNILVHVLVILHLHLGFKYITFIGNRPFQIRA